MSSTGTRKPRDVQSRASEAITESDKELINSFKIFAESSNSVAGLAGPAINNSPKTPAGNYLAREGDSMIGPLALGPPIDFRIVIDSDNTIDIGPLNENPQYTSNVQLDSIQPNSFVLDIIANARFDGQILVLRTFAATFTISQGTLGNGGNIQTGDGNDLIVGDLQTVTLIFDASLLIEANTGGSWRVLSVSSGGGGTGVSFPIDFPEDDRGTVGASTQVIDFTASDRHSVIIEMTGDIGISLTNTTAGTLQITSIKLKQDGTGGRAFIGFSQGVANEQTIIDAVDDNNAPNGFVEFVVEFSDGLFTAYLKTGNIVTGGGDASQWATFTAVSDVNVGTFDMFNIDRLLLVSDSGLFNSSSDIGFVASTGGLLSNVPTGNSYFWKIQNINHMSLSVDALDTVLDIIAPDNGSIPKLRLFALDPSPTIGQKVGTLDFIALNAASTSIIYGGIDVDIEDTTTSLEDGSTSIVARSGGTLVTFISMNDSADGNITAFRDFAFDTGRNLFMNSNRIYSTTNSNDTFIDGDSLSFQFFIDNTTAKATFGTDKLLLANDYFLQTQIVEHRDLTVDPSFPLDGSIWYNSTDEKLRGIEGGVKFDFSSGGGANTALSNLLSVAINTSLLPAGDGTLNLGSASFSWLDTFTERLRIETGGASTSTANQIISDAGGMVFNTPAGDRYEFNISGSPNGISIEEDRIEFLTNGRQHRIDVTGTSINILSENISDSVEIWTGTGRTNATIDINSTTTTFLTQTSDVQAILIQLIQNNNTPANFRTIGNIDFIAENSVSSDEIYARVSASSQDITNATEDGLLQLGVVSGGTLIASIDMEGDSAGGSLIGFFGVTPVARQSPAANSTAIITALENLGLFV